MRSQTSLPPSLFLVICLFLRVSGPLLLFHRDSVLLSSNTYLPGICQPCQVRVPRGWSLPPLARAWSQANPSDDGFSLVPGPNHGKAPFSSLVSSFFLPLPRQNLKPNSAYFRALATTHLPPFLLTCAIPSPSAAAI